jgi:hypothetical protein
MNLELTTYKNYKELCKVMDWTPKSGNTKISQIKDLERFCKYHKQGNKFIIDEIFEIPLEKQENKGNSIYAENIDKLIIHMCSETEHSKYHYSEFSTNGILNKLHIINSNYSVGRNNIDKFSRWLEIPIETLYDFFNSTYKKNKDIVEGGLNRLKSRCLIDWYKVTKVKPNDGDYRNATDGELEGIKEIEQEVLKNMYLENKKDVFLKGKWNLFQKEVSKMLRELMELEYSFEAYHIVSTKKFRTMLLEEREKEDIEWELNYDVQQSSIKSAENRHIKVSEKYRPTTTLKKRTSFGIPYYDKDKNRLSKNYIDDTKRVVRICIDTIDPINLWEAIREIEDKKYKYSESIMTDTQKEYELLGVNTEEWDKLFG